MARTRTRPSSRRPPAKKRRSTAASRTQRPSQTAKALSPHKGDIQGVALVLAAILLALGVWLHNGGNVGVFLELFLRGLFGYGAYAVPVLVAGLGLVHLARGNPPVSAKAAVLQDSGGWVGAAIAHPTARLLSVWGGRAGFTCLLFLGLLISTRTSVAAVGRGAARILRLARAAVTPPPAAGQAAEVAGKGRTRRPALTPPSADKLDKADGAEVAAALEGLGGEVED